MLVVDRADKLIDAARALAVAHAIGNVDFEVMSLDALTLPDKSVDAAISQFAFLQEGDVAVSAKELARVLKDGAPFSVAAFDAMDLNTLVTSAIQVLQRHVPVELLPDGSMSLDSRQRADSAPMSAKLLQNATLKTYPGFPHRMPTTQADTINAELLAFLQSLSRRPGRASQNAE